MNENNSPALEIPIGEIPPENSAPPAVAHVGTPAAPPPPPAATLATQGEVTDERQLALDRRQLEIDAAAERLRGEQTTLSERELKIQEREEALRNVPPAPVKVKRKRNWSDPVNAAEEVELN